MDTPLSIPNDGSQEIASAGNSSDTPSSATENASQITDRTLGDSSSDDTNGAGGNSAENSSTEENRRTNADIERKDFELDKKQVKLEALNGSYEYLKDIRDVKRADKIVSRLSNGKYNTRQDLYDSIKSEESVSEIKDEKVADMFKNMTEQNKILKQEIDSLKGAQAQQTNDKVVQHVYEKYPSLQPENDSDNSKWNKFKSEYAIIAMDDPIKRAEKAYKLAFGDEEDKDLQRSLGNLPSGGSGSVRGKPKGLSPEAMKLSKSLGHSDASIQQFLNSNQ